MILLYTDFGHTDPYVGQMHRVIAQQDATLPVIDLFHDAPAFNVKASSYLLPAYCPPNNDSGYCCVVDPGVGGSRAALLLSIGDCHYVGPDNGLFEILMRRYSSVVREITWEPEALSSSFHGRDLFAPVAASKALGRDIATRPAKPGDFSAWPEDLDEVVHIDHFGNLITGRRAETVATDQQVEIAGRRFSYARTFSDLAIGELFWYRNANGLMEIAANQASAAGIFGTNIGDPVLITNN